ncbi:MAG TPA: 50S ribosomal protein L32 [bacterium]|nr:50S ribosomal protein L32 [bacterium]
MGLTKRRFSKARTASRRAVFRTRAVTLVDCPQCHARMVPHRACPTCGYYGGRQVIQIKTKEDTSA